MVNSGHGACQKRVSNTCRARQCHIFTRPSARGDGRNGDLLRQGECQAVGVGLSRQPHADELLASNRDSLVYPWGSKTPIRSCGEPVVLVNEPTEQVASLDVLGPDRCRIPGFGERGREGRATRRRCQRSRVTGRTKKLAQRRLGSRREAAARKIRSASDSSGRVTCRRRIDSS